MKKIHLFLVLLLISLAVPANILATDSPQYSNRLDSKLDTVKTNIEAKQQLRQENRQEIREEIVDNRCQRVESKIQNRLNSYNDHSDQYNNRYNGVKTRIQELVNKLSAKGCDVSQVQNDLTQLETLIEEFAAAFRVFIASLTDTKGFVCGESEGKYKASVQTANQNLLTVKQNSLNIRSFYTNTLKPHVKTMGETCREAE